MKNSFSGIIGGIIFIIIGIIVLVMNERSNVINIHDVKELRDSYVEVKSTNVDKENENVSEIVLNVGKMTGIVPDYLHRYFPEAAKGTAAEKAKLIINYIPVSGICLDCGFSYEPSSENDYRCPKCRSLKFDLKSGREFEMVSITAVKA